MEATIETSTKQLTNKLKVTYILDRYGWHAQLDQQGYSDLRLEHIDRVLSLNIACSSGWLGGHLYACNSCVPK